MNAKKALELGFVDEILFEDKKPEPSKEDDPDEEPKDETPKGKMDISYPVTDVLYSRKTVEDSFIAKVVNKEPETPGIRITDLDKRLSLLSH